MLLQNAQSDQAQQSASGGLEKHVCCQVPGWAGLVLEHSWWEPGRVAVLLQNPPSDRGWQACLWGNGQVSLLPDAWVGGIISRLRLRVARARSQAASGLQLGLRSWTCYPRRGWVCFLPGPLCGTGGGTKAKGGHS